MQSARGKHMNQNTNPIRWNLAIHLQLPHLKDNSLRAVDEVLVNGSAVAQKLFLLEAI